MRDVAKTLQGAYKFGPNVIPSINILTGSYMDTGHIISSTEKTVIKGSITVKKDSFGRYYCDNKYIKILKRRFEHRVY